MVEDDRLLEVGIVVAFSVGEPSGMYRIRFEGGDCGGLLETATARQYRGALIRIQRANLLRRVRLRLTSAYGGGSLGSSQCSSIGLNTDQSSSLRSLRFFSLIGNPLNVSG